MRILITLGILIHLVNPALLGSNLDNRIQIRKNSSLKFQESNSEQFNEEKQTLLNRKRVALIQDIKKFIREARSNDQKAELNLRLGSLYMEEYHFLMSKAQAKFERDSQEQTKMKGKRGANITLDTSEAMASLEKARVIYKDLINRFPTHPRKDEMLYFLAILSQDKGSLTESISYLDQIVRETPKSKFAAEALLQLGDYYFEKNNFVEAENYFNRTAARKDPKTLPYATYKKAWCAYNNQKYHASLELFKSIIDWESSENSQYLMRLRNEALRDIALPFVELRLANEALAFYRSQGETNIRQGLESMANLFLEKADYKNAIMFNETLLSLDNNGIKNPDYDLALIDSLRLSGDNEKAISRLFATLPNYLPGSSWYEINAGSPEVIKNAANRFEETARKYALEIHAEGQKTKNDKLYHSARSLYQKYLEYFANTPHATTIRFYLAEIQYKQELFIAAADNYYAVYKSPLAGNLRLDSIHYALNALDKQMNIERKKAGLSEISKANTSKLKETEQDSEVTPLSPVEAKFITVGEDYIAHFPKANDTAGVLYQIAYLKYSHFDFPESYKSFWAVVQSYPGQSVSYSSGYLILDILNRRKDYSKLVSACQKLLSTTALAKADFKQEVGNILRHSELKRIQLIEEKGDFNEAAQAYTEYTKAYGAQDEALFEKALYNASVNFYKAGAVMPTLESQEHFLRRFTRSNLRENMLLQVAKTYESLANFEKAAAYFEQFATQYPSNKQASSALRLAGLYYWGARNDSRAEAIMKTFIAKYPRESGIASGDLLELYESQGATNKLVNYYLEDRSQRGISYAQYLSDTLKIAELQGSKRGALPFKTMEEALKISQKFNRDLMQSKAGIEQTSKVLFWFASQKENLFYRIKLALPQRALELNLKRKLALLKELENEFSHIAKLGGGEWGLGAIYKTASAYRALAQDINQAPVPAELSGEQLEQYRLELKRQMIVPFNEKALSLIGQCLDKAQEFNLLSHWTPKCYSLGSEINGERYPSIKTFYLQPYRVAVMDAIKDSKIPKGTLSRYHYPFDSANLFSTYSERSISSVPSSLPVLFDGAGGFVSEANRATPSPFNYRLLETQRKEILSKALDETRPNKSTNYGYLHYLRLVNPQKAQRSILEAIQTDPNNYALHNLLGLCYFDLGQYTAAKVTWLSLIARGGSQSGEAQNNLGVLLSLMGKETQAIEQFKAAAQNDNAIEAWVNLGFMALKYRNGFEAKQYFQKAVAANENDAVSQVGLGVSLLQNREFESAKNSLADATQRFKSDPFAKLSYVYLLLDIEKEQEAARLFLEEYLRVQPNVDRDNNFRQVFNDVRKGSVGTSSTSVEGLPSITN